MKPREAAGRGGQSMDRLARTLTQALGRGQTHPDKKTTFKKHPQKLQKLFHPTRMPSSTAKNALTFPQVYSYGTYRKPRGLLYYSNRIPLYIEAKPAPSARKQPQRVESRVEKAGRVSDMRPSTPTPSTGYALAGISGRGAVAA